MTQVATRAAAQAATRALAQYVADAHEVPEPVRKHAARTFLNFVGCVVGGSHHEAVDKAARTLLPLSGSTAATVIGRSERADPLLAAMLNGMSGAVYSFDDTHAEAVVHPGGPVGCALLAYAETHHVTGAEFLLAYSLGIEVVCRISKAVSVAPAVNEPAWVQTGITGGIGAAAAVGRLLGLDADEMAAAFGIAVCQAGGLRSLSRTMCFSLMAGQAAQAGLRAALLAGHGFSGGSDVLEHSSGFLRVYSKEPHAEFVTRGLGEQFELLQNTFKPYPCGVVIHPAIDACLDIAARIRGERTIEGVVVRLHPASVALGNIPAPRNVQECQVSIQHWVAAALVDGEAGLAQGRSEKLTDPAIVALRSNVRLEEDASLARDASTVQITLAGGELVTSRVEHCRGSAARPLSDEDLAVKFRSQCAQVMGADDVGRLLALCQRIDSLQNIAIIARAGAAMTHH